MNICFICGSLEPGKDGVGDYTLTLAAELLNQQQQVSIIAFNDRYCNEILETFQGTERQEGIRILRLPSSLSEIKRSEKAKNFISKLNPNLISLQFVPYAFQLKGLPYLLGNNLYKIGGDRKWHIMFHELWIGMPESFSVRHFWFLRVQRYIIRKLISRLCPIVIHTQLPDFISKLKEFGWKPKELPLFSNIPVLSADSVPLPDREMFTIGFFSQMRISNAIVAFLNELAVQIKSEKKSIIIKFIGGAKKKVEDAVTEYQQKIDFDCTFQVTGYLQPRELSGEIRRCDIGVTPIPRHALGKGGSIAALITHKIPVAAPNVSHGYAENNIGFFSNDLVRSIIFQPDLSSVASAKEAAVHASSLINVEHIGRTFLNDIFDVLPSKDEIRKVVKGINY